MNLKENTGWSGELTISVYNKGRLIERDTIKNMITDAGLNLIRNALYGDTVDCEINYIAVGDGNTAVSAAHTALVNETFRTAVTTQTKTSTGVLDIVGWLLDSDGALTIEEVGIFAGGTAVKDSGTLIARVLWSRAKTALESIKIARTDTLGRG